LPAGANLPWQRYGCDFGANAWQPGGGVAARDRQEQLAPALEAMAQGGAQVVRWFLLGDGRAGLRLDAKGRAAGLDDHVYADMEAALVLASSYGLGVMFVLTDFLWFRRAEVVRGVRLFGKRGLVAKADRQAELLDRVFTPLLERFGSDSRVYAWDAFNEPEWAVLGLGTVDAQAALLDTQMRAYLRELVGRIRATTRQRATVGLAGPRGLGLVRGLDLDFYQWHWYDKVEGVTPLAQPVAEHQVDRPVLLGEFPTRGSSRTPDVIHSVARAAGYGAAWPWSLLAEDEATDRAACLGAIVSGQAPRA